MKMKCPRCKKEMIYNLKNEHRPFCSDRCKNADFLNWHDENYRVPDQPVNTEDLEKSDRSLPKKPTNPQL